MKVKLKVEKEFDIKYLKLSAGVRYWEDSQINGEDDTEDGAKVPFKKGDKWCPVIDINMGQIMDWPQGTTASIHYKVCDCCGWEIVTNEGETVLSAKDGYVPDCLAPDGEGYGDYIIFEIDGFGYIKDWQFEISEFINEEN